MSRAAQARRSKLARKRRQPTIAKGQVRAAESLTIFPKSCARVRVHARFPLKGHSLFVERQLHCQNSIDDVYGSPDQLINRQTPQLFISNFGDIPISIRCGDFLGQAHNPANWLDHPSNFTEADQPRICAYGALVKSLVNHRSQRIHCETSITSKAQRNAEGPDDILASAPVEGGPKTAFEAEDTVTSAQLLQEVDICTDLSVEQRQKLTDVIMTNANAFGLDKRLGDYEGLVDIPLKPGTKPISLPPFAASPANRKVI
ncbi:hypothetical protein FISHEDRAFT_46346, partial [Fistulina hepatica ATCC 64428]